MEQVDNGGQLSSETERKSVMERLSVAIDKLCIIFDEAAKLGKTIDMPNFTRRGMKFDMVLLVEPTGRVGKVFGSFIYQPYGEDVLYWGYKRSGGSRYYGSEQGVFGSFNRGTDEVYLQTSMTTYNMITNDGPYNRFPKGKRTTSNAYNGKKNGGITGRKGKLNLGNTETVASIVEDFVRNWTSDGT